VKTIISHSEVDQFLNCERKHYYGFGKKLQPKVFGKALRRGSMGHAVLEVYYKAIQSGLNYDQAADNALGKFGDFISQPGYDLELLADLQELLIRYFDYAPTLDENDEILYVENEFRLPISTQVEYPYRPDLIVKDRSTGKIKVIDHKFLYNFYTMDDMKISPQLTKYVAALRGNGVLAKEGWYNMLRWRKVKDKSPEASFRREYVPINNARISITFREQIAATEQIAEYKKMYLDVWEMHVLRTASAWNCKNCPFLSLCTADLSGIDSAMIEKYDYEPNTYGYYDLDEVQ
jgi:CRISPR/Cas system-associated exonuclease Cas4 (RecB family)